MMTWYSSLGAKIWETCRALYAEDNADCTWSSVTPCAPARARASIWALKFFGATNSVQDVWEPSPYAASYVVQQVSTDGRVAGGKEITDRDQRLILYTAAPGTPSHKALRLLAVVGIQQL